MSRGLLPRQLPLHLVRFGRLHPRLVVAFAVIAWVVTGLLPSRVEVETDILSLVPRNNPVVEGFRTTVERFGSVDTLLVVIHLDADRPIEDSLGFAEMVVGFGSLVLSHYPGLRSVGAAAILGALSTAILGITLLPALLSMREE